MRGTYKFNDDFYFHYDKLTIFNMVCYYVGYFLGQVLVVALAWYFILDCGGLSWDEKVKTTQAIFEFFAGLYDIFVTGLQEFPDL